MLFKKADTSLSHESKEFYSLGILELILGLGMSFGAILSLPLKYLPYPIWDKFGRTTIFVIATLGCVFVLINYILRSKLKWTIVLFAGAVAFGCLVAAFCVSIDVGSSFRNYLFLSGTPFIITGYALISNRDSSNVFQQIFCFLFAVAMLFLAFISWQHFISWREAPNIFALTCILISLPACYLVFALQDLKFEKPLRIALRVFFIILFSLWLFVLVIGIPNFINAEQRGRQKRTMGHLRSIATAVEAYGEDQKTYPPTQSIHDLSKILEPTYIKQLPRQDGWHWTIEYYGTTFQDNAFQGYVIRSPGRDGKFEYKDPTAYKDGPVEGFERDLVFSIGSLSQWPEGTMPP